MSLPETDWKQLTRLKPLALERLCRRILEEAQALIAAAGEGDSHRVYLALFNHIQEHDRLIADGFDDWSRSRAIEHLVVWRGRHLVTDEEFAAFSPETRAAVEFWLSGPP
jgi:hypothetical protein